MDLAAVQARADAARKSLELIGEGDWTPQDILCAQMLRDVPALVARVRQLETALRNIDWTLTTVEGDNVARGDAPKVTVRALAREALAAGGDQ